MPVTHEVLDKSHPDQKIFQNKAKECVLFTNFAYKQTDKEMYALANSLPPNYELLLMTDHNEGTKDASFRCAVFMNRSTKEIVCATAGTRLGFTQKGFDDVVDDGLLGLKQQPLKMKAARNLNDQILGHLGDEINDYKFTYTGHSLGAAMAEMQAADMDIQLTHNGVKKNKEQITAVTFENPGTKNILKKMYKAADMELGNIQDNMNVCEFNNRKNIINNSAKQAGRAYTIVPHSQAEHNPSTAQMVCDVIIRKCSELSSILSEVFTLLAPGGIGTSFVEDHSMSKFNEVFVQEQGDVMKKGQVISLEEAYTNIKPVKYDESIVDIIRKQRSENDLDKDNIKTGTPEFSMNGVKSETSNLDRIVFSAEEAKMAMTQLKAEGKDKTKKISSNPIKRHFVREYKKSLNHALPTLKQSLSPKGRSR